MRGRAGPGVLRRPGGGRVCGRGRGGATDNRRGGVLPDDPSPAATAAEAPPLPARRAARHRPGRTVSPGAGAVETSARARAGGVPRHGGRFLTPSCTRRRPPPDAPACQGLRLRVTPNCAARPARTPAAAAARGAAAARASAVPPPLPPRPPRPRRPCGRVPRRQTWRRGASAGAAAAAAVRRGGAARSRRRRRRSPPKKVRLSPTHLLVGLAGVGHVGLVEWSWSGRERRGGRGWVWAGGGEGERV